MYPDKLPRNQLHNILSPFLYKWPGRLPGLVLDHTSSALAPAWKSIPHRLRQKHYLPFSVIAASQSHVTLPPYGYSSLSKVSVTFRHSSQGLSKPGDSCHIKSIPMWWRRQVWGATRAFPGLLCLRCFSRWSQHVGNVRKFFLKCRASSGRVETVGRGVTIWEHMRGMTWDTEWRKFVPPAAHKTLNLISTQQLVRNGHPELVQSLPVGGDTA